MRLSKRESYYKSELRTCDSFSFFFFFISATDQTQSLSERFENEGRVNLSAWAKFAFSSVPEEDTIEGLIHFFKFLFFKQKNTFCCHVGHFQFPFGNTNGLLKFVVSDRSFKCLTF